MNICDFSGMMGLRVAGTDYDDGFAGRTGIVIGVYLDQNNLIVVIRSIRDDDSDSVTEIVRRISGKHGLRVLAP